MPPPSRTYDNLCLLDDLIPHIQGFTDAASSKDMKAMVTGLGSMKKPIKEGAQN